MSDLRVTQSRALRHVTDEKAGRDVTSKECGIWFEDGDGDGAKLIVQCSCLCKLKYVHSNAITF